MTLKIKCGCLTNSTEKLEICCSQYDKSSTHIIFICKLCEIMLVLCDRSDFENSMSLVLY